MLADWNALATPHPEWFTADQVHLNPAGATALAALIASTGLTRAGRADAGPPGRPVW